MRMRKHCWPRIVTCQTIRQVFVKTVTTYFTFLFFFDGTGNNDRVDTEKKKWSNVARIYLAAQLAAQMDTSGTLYPVYVAGVGTKFNGRAADWLATVVGMGRRWVSWCW